MPTEKQFTTVEENKKLDRELAVMFRERIILGFCPGACDVICNWGNLGYFTFYVYGITHENFPLLEQELKNRFGKLVKVDVRSKNTRYCNVLVEQTYREVFNGPLVQEWYENCLETGKIIHKHGGWLGMGFYPAKDEQRPWVLPFHYTYQLQLKEYGFPDWN